MPGLKHHINLKYILLILLMQIAVVKTVFSQEYYYKRHLDMGNKQLNAQPPKYVDALKQYNLARKYINDEKQKKEIDSLTAYTQKKIDLLIEEKKAAVTDANVAKEDANNAKMDAVKAWKETQKSLAKTQKIISAFYFYEDRFALAYKNNKYGFIDKNGNQVIPYKYEEARPFDYTGLSRVRYNKQLYLLDNKTKEYKLAIGPDNLDSTIQALELSNRQLTELPAMIVKDSNIKILLLNGNEITQLDSSITRFSQLSKLFIYSNKLDSIPDEIGLLDSLNTLDASINKLRWISDSISQLTDLGELVLYDNSLTSLPGSMGSLQKLSVLDVSNNLLKSLPKGIDSLRSLRILALGENQFDTFPPGLKKLTGLKMLDLNGNFIKEVPGWIENLNLLTHLNVWNNQLISLPNEITKIDSLKILVAGKNRLVSLPANMDSLKNLEELVLYDNMLKTIPSELVKLKKLKKLDLRENEGLDPGSVLTVFKESKKKLIISTSDIDLDYLEGDSTLLIRIDSLKTIPKELADLKNLVLLDIYNCNDISEKAIRDVFKNHKEPPVFSNEGKPQLTENKILINGALPDIPE